MAKVRMHGTIFNADPVRQLPSGAWIMTARSHGPRWVPGTEVEIHPDEVIEMAAAEMPGGSLQAASEQPTENKNLPISPSNWPASLADLDAAADTLQADLDAAMAEERRTLPSVATLVAAAREAGTIPQPDAPYHGVAIPEGTEVSQALADKLAAIATIPEQLTKTITEKADALIARKGVIEARATDAFARHNDVLGQVEQGVAAVEGALSKITNQ